MAKKIGIAGELESKTTEGKLADASQIKDSSRENKSQKEINDEFQSEIESNILGLEIDETTGDITATTGADTIFTDVNLDETTGELVIEIDY